LLGEGENGACSGRAKTLDGKSLVKVLNTEIAQDEAAVEKF